MAEDWQTAWIEAAGDEARIVLARLPALCARLPDPQRGERDLRRFLAAGDPREVAQRLALVPEHLEHLLRIASLSRYGLDCMVRRPESLWAVSDGAEHRQVWGRQSLSADLAQRLASASDPAAALVEFKERHYLRLILGDALDTLGFEALIAELSDLVDVIVQACLDQAIIALAARFPDAAVRFTVLGMGKLGGRELNYSSDIDLIFVYEDQNHLENHEYCQKLGSDLIRRLDEATMYGRLYRVDMRLRPEGDRGELALSLRETIDYYYSVGRPWERQAMIKARPIAGDLALGNRLLEELRPWIFPQDPAWEDLDGTRSMRKRIEERKEEANIKTGAGGIRDIEFLVQFFQLSHGGRLRELRGRATLPTLRALGDLGILPKTHSHELEGHYRFLRIVEHRLQMWEDRQVHEVPVAADEKLSLARRCGFSGPDGLTAFTARLAGIRARVRAIADRHYLRATRLQDAVLALLVQEEIDADLIETVLTGAGLRDPLRAAQHLRAMAREPFFVLARSRTERSLANLVPLLLELIKTTPSPDQTLENLARIAAAVGGRATFYDLLAGNPKLLRLVIDLSGWATYLVNLLGEVPGLPDELLDTLTRPPRRPDLLFQEARHLVHGISDLESPLRFFQARELAAVAVRDLDGWPQRQVTRQLSHLAIAILAVVVERSTALRARDWGLPEEGHRQTRFTILGLGKLGSRSLSYASDMDVIFACDPGGRCRGSDHDGEQFWTRTAQEVMRVLGEAHIYEIDPRLRPWGEQGELVPTIEALKRYWSDPRDIWERMAMLRAAYIAGDPSLGQECLTLIRTAALSAPLPPDAAQQVRDMRRRLEESVADRDHVKRGWGGYVDHEFLAQYLSFGVPPRDLPVGCATIDTLARLGELGRLPAEAVVELTRGYDWLRFVEARSRLSAGKAISSIPTDPVARLELAKRCSQPDLTCFDLEMHTARKHARAWFERLIV